MENVIGSANFNYYLNASGDTVLHGGFSFVSENVDSLGRFIQRRVNGTYHEGKKDKVWQYIHNTFEVSINTVNERFQVQTSLNGTTQKLEANYDMGEASGMWKLEEFMVDDGKLSKQLKNLQVNFQESRLIGPFSFFVHSPPNSTQIKGQFNTRHFFDGKWELTYRKDSIDYHEERLYDDGFLISLVQKDNSNGITIFEVSFDRVKQKLQDAREGKEGIDFKIGSDFFDVFFDDGFPYFSKEEISQKNGNEILNDLFSLISSNTLVIGLKLEGSPELLPAATRRFEYTLTAKERELLDKAEKSVNRYISDLEKFVNNTSLALYRQRSDSLSFSFRYAERILGNLQIVRDNLDLLHSDYFKYQSKRTYFRPGVEGLLAYDTVRYSYDGQQRSKVIPNEVDFSNSDLIIQNLFTYVEKKGAIIETLDPFFKSSIIEIEEFLVSQQLEEDILMYLKRVEETYDVKRGIDAVDKDGVILTRFHVAMYSNYEQKRDLLMQEYTNLIDFEKKQAVGLEILELTKVYIDAYAPVGEVRKKLQQLDEAYTRMSYNPYMDRHDIKTRIKRNIYFAAIDHLLPSYRENIIDAESYEEIPRLLTEMDAAFQRLFELAKLPDSETQVIERRLRRESNPNRIKRILEL
ncbi:hypothetical protein ACFFF3_15570 [Mongoliitalea lutea]